ncbi:MAG: phage holin family protein [Bacteroidia bacterium]
MEAKACLIEPLLERAEAYSKTSLEVLKLKYIDKASDLISAFMSRLMAILVLSVFVLTLNIALALWLGDLMGKSYYGFLIVALFYGLIGMILYFIHPKVKASIKNFIIANMLHE